MIETSPRPGIKAVSIAVGAAFLSSLIIVMLLSRKPAETAFHFFLGPLLSRFYAGNLLDGAALLMCTGAGITIAFRSGTFNLGGEGQSYIGALLASQIALAPVFTRIPGAFGIPIVLLVCALSGGVIAAISGVLRATLEIDELITSFLVSRAIRPITDYLVSGPLRDPDGYLLATPEIPLNLRLEHVLEPSSLNVGLVVGIVLVLIISFSIRHTLFGYELRMTGMNRRFAAYGGIRTGTYLVAGITASGALHGLAGGLYVIGTRYLCAQGGTGGLGWNGIAVALIAENLPLAVIPASIVFSYLQTATKAAMLDAGFSFELSAIVQATVFLLITVKRFGKGRT